MTFPKNSKQAAIHSAKISKQVELTQPYQRKNGSIAKAGTVYKSVKSASIDLQLTAGAVSQMCKTQKRMRLIVAPTFYYVYNGQTYKTQAEMSQLTGIPKQTISRWVKEGSLAIVSIED